MHTVLAHLCQQLDNVAEYTVAEDKDEVSDIAIFQSLITHHVTTNIQDETDFETQSTSFQHDDVIDVFAVNPQFYRPTCKDFLGACIE